MIITKNIMLGSELWHDIDSNVVIGIGYRKVAELSERCGFEVNLDALFKDICFGDYQRVEILKTLYRGATLLILDEL